MFRIFLAIVASSLVGMTAALAQQPLDGWLIAMQSCEAYQSKKRLTNPGDVRLSDRVAYEMIGIDKPGGEWYQVRVPDAPVTAMRWVPTSCGIHVIAAGGGAPDPVVPADSDDPGSQKPVSEPEAIDLLLALTWQPAFCESRPSTTECRQVNDGLLPIAERQLSLHGLWPQPRGNDYCGVGKEIVRLDKARRWRELPAPQLDADTAERLAVAMPGVASFLDRHEWIKHGTCFFGEGNGQEYFADSLRLLEAINGSTVGTFLAENVGAVVETADLRAAFDDAFGSGAGQRVHVTCKSDGNRVLIQELKISLFGEVTETSDVGALIRAADTQNPGCTRGAIDPAGLQ